MSSPPKAPRRFKPQLVEQTNTSSTKTKRFEPQHISTSTRSSRNPQEQDASQPTSTPVADEQNNAGASGSAQPVPDHDPPRETPKPRRKFNVQPVETSTRNNRKQEAKSSESDTSPLLSHEKLNNEAAKAKEERPRRKFTPQLIETASRSRKSGDTVPTVLPSDKTNVSPGDAAKRERPNVHPIPPSNTPRASLLEVPQLKQVHQLKPAPARQGSMRPHPNTRANSKQHSFKVPDLPDIESSESDENSPPSLSRSQVGDSDSSDEGYKDATRMRESLDQNFSGYLLALAARAAEKQLREQAAEAFPNTDFHEPVAHYINRSDSEGDVSEPKLSRYGQVDNTKMDSGDEIAAIKEMRKHGERVFEQQKSRKKATGFDVEFDEEPSRQDIWTDNGAQGPFTSPSKAPKKVIGGRQQCAELKQMRKAASPPMLGDEISFPRCASPDHARFDVTQGADYLRKNICYLSEQSNQQVGLWGKNDAKKTANKKSSAKDNKKQDQKPKEAQGQGKALWGGHCNQENQKPVKAPVGLVTPMRTPLGSPRNERDDPMAGLSSSAMPSGPTLQGMTPVKAPPSPPSAPSPERDKTSELYSPPSCSMLDWRLEIEARVDEEFNDGFVTQVYNYLSFGYPALAKNYDEELERVAKVPVAHLREDDQLADARGYVRLGEDEFDGSVRGLDEVNCRRWRALRRYIKEWGRQMMIKEREEGGATWGVGGYDPHRAWGLPNRRGSWAL